MVSDKYCGKVYYVDYDGNESTLYGYAHRYISWYNTLMRKSGSDTWPFDVSGAEGTDYLEYWWFSTTVVDQGVHLPIYYQYYGWGGYRAPNQSDIPEGNYKNASFSYENVVFKGDIVKKAVNGRKEKREYTDTDADHIETIVTPHYFFLSVNIENGDGVNKKLQGNKVMYVNDYEIPTPTAQLPINFKVRTSEDISKIELFRTSVSDANRIAEYIPASTNNIKAKDTDLVFTERTRGTTLTLYNETVYAEPADAAVKTKPARDAEHHDLYIYSYGIKIKDGATLKTSMPGEIKTATHLSGVNTKFILRITVEPVEGMGKSVSDEIYVVKRGFFSLD